MRFYLIDKITRWETGVAAEGLKNVAMSEDFFDDHFPRRPVMPGVLILEGMTQLGAVLVEETLQESAGKGCKAILRMIDKTKFKAMIKPGDTLHYRVEMTALAEGEARLKGVATRSQAVVATTELVFSLNATDDPELPRKRRELLDLWTGKK